MEIFGFIAAYFMGLTLGTLGGGGSILTVPILVYLMQINPVTATGYSLLIVGMTASFGAYRYFKKGIIHLKSSLLFAIPSIIAVYATRAVIMPALPDILLHTPFTLSKDLAIMVLFAILMMIAALLMLKNGKKTPPPQSSHHPVHLIILEGGLVGVATGMLGAGGGFLIIPALVLFMGLPMKEAVASSLLIIALKSLIGFIGDLQNGINLDVSMLIIFIALTFCGMFTATSLSSKIKGEMLQKTFAYFIFIIATLILYKELL